MKTEPRKVEVKEEETEEELEGVDVFGAAEVKTEENADESVLNTEREEESQKLLISDDLRLQEEKIRLENEKKQAKQAAKEEKEEERVEMTSEERYQKLMDLLSKSSFYSKFLLEKMESQDDATKIKDKKTEDRKKLKEAQLKKEKKENSKRNSRGSAKRKADDDDDDAPLTGSQSKRSKSHLSRKCNGEDIPDDQPLLLTGGIMRDYQIRGYQWMATLFENGINGILADEMGLGKTIQTIALFCHLAEMGVPGPFLVVAPLSTVPNWVKEFKKFAPAFPVVLYHGNAAERMELRKKKMGESATIEGIETKVKNVFVTSFEIAMNDRPHFSKVLWRYIVVDEGHRLKNMNCRLIKELRQYQSVNRLLLTGTPLQNNLAELWSLLNFLMSEIFDDLRVFESWFNAKNMDTDKSEAERIVMQEKQNNILSTLHQILTPFLLRRVKADVDLKIPPKKEVLVYCPMSQKQQDMYEAIVNRTIAAMVGEDDSEKEVLPETELVGSRMMRKKTSVDYNAFLGNDGESERSLEKYLEAVAHMETEKEKRRAGITHTYNEDKINMTNDVRISIKGRMMDLRKATNHPYLIEYPLTEDGVFYRTDQDLVDICGKFKVLDQLLDGLLERKHKVLIFSQMTRMLDILGDYLNFRKFNFSRLDGSMHFEDRQDNIDKFNEDPETNIFLLSTRAGGLGINLTAADTCIIYDSDWNPQQDLQAQDRCHRIGQTKPVMVYRLVTANTVDQKIVERAAAKRKLEKMVIHSKKFKSQDSSGLKKTMETVTPQELLELLNSKDHAGIVERKDGAVFKKEELDLLLDRRELTWAKLKKEEIAKEAGDIKRKSSKVKTDSIFKVIDTEGIPTGLQSVRDPIT